MKQDASPEVRDLLAHAVGHHQAGRLDEAIACYHRVLALKPDLASAHNNLATALCEQGKLEEAELSYRQALALQPGLASAHSNLGTVLFERDKLDDAIACYRQALALEPDYAAALDNLGAALHRQGKLDEAETSIRRALAIRPDFAGAHDNLGILLWQRGEAEEALASTRRALALAPGFMRALENLGAMLKDQGRLDEALEVYRELFGVAPRHAWNGIAEVLAAQGDTTTALKTIQQSLRAGESQGARRIFAEIVRPFRWTTDDSEMRSTLARALTEAWIRPGELARTSASLIKQHRRTGPCIARAVEAWPRPLSAGELFGAGGPQSLAQDTLLLALLVSAQNCDIELERFLTMARRSLLEAATTEDANDAGLEFHAALARQCFINEYVFFHSEQEIHRACELRDALSAALDADAPISRLQLVAVAAYFPLHSVSGADRLKDRAWPEPATAVLVQQVREPHEEAQLLAALPKLTAIEDPTSRLVQHQYEENPYPRWVRMPSVEGTQTIAGYLRQRFPFAVFQRERGGEIVDVLSAGCGTGRLALEIAQNIKSRVLAVDLSVKSLGYAARKARELGLGGIEFAQADVLELGALGRRFDVVECSGVLHHLADLFHGWRVLLSLLRPGGYMVLGLYSESARAQVVKARRFIAAGGYGSSSDEIRRCRQDLLEKERGGDITLSASDDFFGIGSCRDLLFHVHEVRTELPRIADFLGRNGLTLLGFELDDAVLNAYRRRFPDDRAATDLGNWQVFEHDNPATFSGMYKFWVQKN